MLNKLPLEVLVYMIDLVKMDPQDLLKLKLTCKYTKAASEESFMNKLYIENKGCAVTQGNIKIFCERDAVRSVRMLDAHYGEQLTDLISEIDTVLVHNSLKILEYMIETCFDYAPKLRWTTFTLIVAKTIEYDNLDAIKKVYSMFKIDSCFLTEGLLIYALNRAITNHKKYKVLVYMCSKHDFTGTEYDASIASLNICIGPEAFAVIEQNFSYFSKQETSILKFLAHHLINQKTKALVQDLIAKKEDTTINNI